MNRHHRQCFEICQAAGLQIVTVRNGKHHLKIVCRQGILVFPCTPSDHRWAKNLRATARRMAAAQ